jgi:NDP-sugar pyrophosphorylase family protein
MNPVQPSPQAIILCGGKGTRLSALYSDRPKILVPIAGRPFLEWQLEWLGQAGITDIHLAAGYKAEVLAAYAAGVLSSAAGQRPDGSENAKHPTTNVQQPTPNGETVSSHPLDVGRWALDVGRSFEVSQRRVQGSGGTIQVSGFRFQVSLSSEPSPLGTGGGLKFVEPWLRSDPFLVLNGDSLSPGLDFEALKAAHNSAHTAVDARGYRETGAITIAVARIAEAGRYGTVDFDEAGRVTAFREKAARESGWINAGVYLIDRAILAAIPPDRNLSIETDVYPDLVRRGMIHACPIAPPMLDMGTPEGIRAMEAYLGSRKKG